MLNIRFDKNVPHVMGLPDHVPSFWQTLTLLVVFGSYPLGSSQTKHALEPGVVPVRYVTVAILSVVSSRTALSTLESSQIGYWAAVSFRELMLAKKVNPAAGRSQSSTGAQPVHKEIMQKTTLLKVMFECCEATQELGLTESMFTFIRLLIQNAYW